MKSICALLSTILFAVLSFALLYYTKELWENVTSLTTITAVDPKTILIIFTECFLISGFLVFLLIHMKEEFHNLKNISEDKLIYNLFIGLTWGSVFGLVFGLVLGLMWALFLGLIWAVIILLVDEHVEKKSIKN